MVLDLEGESPMGAAIGGDGGGRDGVDVGRDGRGEADLVVEGPSLSSCGRISNLTCSSRGGKLGHIYSLFERNRVLSDGG